MPGNSRVRYEALLADYARFEEEAAASRFNRYADAEDKSLGIIACGIAYNYLMENYPDGCPHPVLKISQYPLPQELVRRMASECKALLIIEEDVPLTYTSHRVSWHQPGALFPNYRLLFVSDCIFSLLSNR